MCNWTDWIDIIDVFASCCTACCTEFQVLWNISYGSQDDEEGNPLSLEHLV
jgi:hypothetical protein